MPNHRAFDGPAASRAAPRARGAGPARERAGPGRPATREELIAHAREEHERVVDALRQLPDRRYSRPAEVTRAFAEVASAYVGDVAYPARRADLVACAER